MGLELTKAFQVKKLVPSRMVEWVRLTDVQRRRIRRGQNMKLDGNCTDSNIQI